MNGCVHNHKHSSLHGYDDGYTDDHAYGGYVHADDHERGCDRDDVHASSTRDHAGAHAHGHAGARVNNTHACVHAQGYAHPAYLPHAYDLYGKSKTLGPLSPLYMNTCSYVHE
ncbi:hypothetical protein IV72_GL001006 [Atopobium minutum]|nr:hypothetical protein IV72_GL001006 [Atopobium minutum]